MDSSYRMRRPPTPSPLFLLPVEVRLLIYELVFSSPPTSAEQEALSWSSENLTPLLTCRHVYREARLIAFACTTHNLNWTRASSCLRRLRMLEPAQHAHIRHVALLTSPSGLHDKLLPLRRHLDHSQPPYLCLESLTIVLDIPDIVSDLMRETIMLEQNMVFASVWYYKNIGKVVLMNVLHRDSLREHPALHGEWTCITDETALPVPKDDQPLDVAAMDSIRWRFDLASFYDYAWKPWL